MLEIERQKWLSYILAERQVMTIKLPIISVTLLLTIQSYQLMGQNPVSWSNTTEWETEIVDLPGSNFEEIVQDSSGFMWIGTGDGLIRYDGFRYKIFVHDPDNANSLSSSDISKLHIQDEKYLWIGTYSHGGLNRMDLLTGFIKRYLEGTIITEIISDNKGNIWVGSHDGAYRLDPKTDSIKHFLSFPEETGSVQVLSIIEDGDGIIWAGGGTNTGNRRIWRYQPEIGSFYKCNLASDQEALPNTFVTSLRLDSYGTFWVGTSQGELYHLDRKTSILEKISLVSSSPGFSWVSTIFEDLSHLIWIVTWRGLFKIDPLTNQQTYFSANSPGHQIPKDVGWTICQSQDSVLWIGPLATEPVQDMKANGVGLDPVIPRTNQDVSNLKDLPQILIIEDNQDVIQYIRSVLQNDFQISTAPNGQEGLKDALERIPDLIISDVMMPLMDGFQVCNTLKENQLTSHIPVILLTAKADIDSKLEGLEFGADAYLTKPFNKDELLVRIRSLLSHKQRLQTHYQQLFGVTEVSESVEAEVQISTPENEFIIAVKTLIKENLDDSTFGVDQLCHVMTMSNSQLYRKLKAQTGLSAHELIQSIRLARAKTLLKETPNTIAEIAYDCGFSDPEYFSRVFKKEMGNSPSEFRRR